MYGYIYITTNLINNRKYIGQKKANYFDESYKGSGKILKLAIEKYGWDNFECHILDEINGIKTVCDSKEELDFSENYYITYYNCINSEEYYNLKEGGSGGSQKGLVYLTNTNNGSHKRVEINNVDKYLASGEWIKKGPLQTSETKKKKNDKLKTIIHTKEWVSKISNSLKGKKKGPLSDETKEKLSKLSRVNQPTMKKVQCIETGEIFISLHEAARQFNTCAPNIIRNINGGSPTRGYNWKYID